MGGTKGGVHMRGQIGRQEERGLTAEGWRFPDSAVNNKMWSECKACFTVASVCQECNKYPKIL